MDLNEIKAHNRVYIKQCKEKQVPDNVIGMLHGVAWDHCHAYGIEEVETCFGNLLYYLLSSYESPDRFTLSDY